MECSHFVPKMEAGGSCQLGMWLMIGLWVVSVAWVPAVLRKVSRGVSSFLAGKGNAGFETEGGGEGSAAAGAAPAKKTD